MIANNLPIRIKIYNVYESLGIDLLKGMHNVLIADYRSKRKDDIITDDFLNEN
jgi:hypothetical protein